MLGLSLLMPGFNPIKPGEDRDWNIAETYTKIQADKPVTIAVTDDGLADSVRVLPDGGTSFTKPCDEQMTMSTFLKRLRDENQDEALYLQSQDGNVARSEPGIRAEPELAAFQEVVTLDIPWMRDATGASGVDMLTVGGAAEAVNLWIGTSKSTTSFHHDPYENIYHVLSGSKTFTLLSPIDGLSLDREKTTSLPADKRTLPPPFNTRSRTRRQAGASARLGRRTSALGSAFRSARCGTADHHHCPGR